MVKPTLFCNDLRQKLKFSKKYIELVDCIYNRVKSILDKNFAESFRHETNNRILELCVADQVISYRNNTNIQVSNGSPKKDVGGPDFKIECKNYNIFIECVCANDSTEDCVEKECEIYEIEGYPENIYNQIGSDKRKVARIASSIRYKSRRIHSYKEKNIISDNDIVVLVIGTNFGKIIKSNLIFGEFEAAIAHKSICSHGSSDGTVYDITFEDNDRRKFEKNGKSTKPQESELDYFNVFVYADKYIDCRTRKPGQIFSYKPYVRKLPDECSKEIIQKIFDAEAIEFNTSLYRSDGHERCSKEAILEEYRIKKANLDKS